MQTFLPYENFLMSAKSLDKKRCFKQVVEAYQIIKVLSEDNPAKKGWRNHPAVKMWEGHVETLKMYFNAFLMVSKNDHNINTKFEYYNIDLDKVEVPWWLGHQDFHRAMRARLIQKDPNFYFHKFPKDVDFNDSKYLWPVMQTKTFRII